MPLINVDDDETIRRITGRRSCRTCGAVYHVTSTRPRWHGVCDKDGGELYQRDDDQEETVRNRLFVYYKQTAPLIGYYYAKGLLAEVDGSSSIEEVQAALLALIEGMNEDVQATGRHDCAATQQTPAARGPTQC